MSDIDRYFPRCGPCAFCGKKDARHRVIDSIRARHAVGETVEELAEDYDISVDAVRAALESGDE